jgi:uncharacterized membrane protein YgdD (TMEM256/DUF423 family)
MMSNIRHETSMKKFFVFGSCFGFFGVVIGAFGAHLLKQKLSTDAFQIFEVGVRYQMYHTVALFISGWVLYTWKTREAKIAGWLFIIGIFLFSGSLYLLSLTGIVWFGAVTPLGGLCFLGGWGYLALGCWKGIGQSA